MKGKILFLVLISAYILVPLDAFFISKKNFFSNCEYCHSRFDIGTNFFHSGRHSARECSACHGYEGPTSLNLQCICHLSPSYTHNTLKLCFNCHGENPHQIHAYYVKCERCHGEEEVIRPLKDCRSCHGSNPHEIHKEKDVCYACHGGEAPREERKYQVEHKPIKESISSLKSLDTYSAIGSMIIEIIKSTIEGLFGWES